MFNGQQPPFGAPPAGLPPFPPNFNPNGPPPPGGFPPFRPSLPQGFNPPPFPPSFPPSGMPANGDGSSGFRPPPMGIPGMPPRPGLGMPPPGMGSSPMGTPVPGMPPGFIKEVKTTKVFVGTIAPGITDETLQDLLNACGPLHELKRVSGASGKPQAFGFASFENPEVVMRAVRCLNGIELPDLTPEGKREGKRKALLVKVDASTQEFLDEFEQTLGRSEDDEEADAICRKSIQHMVALLTDPNAAPPEGLPINRQAGARSPIEVIVPAHLQDLKEGDLPEEQRVAVLDQIAIFRENAARREREKKALEDEKDRFNNSQRGPTSPATSRVHASANYGYGNRGMEKENQRKWGAQQSQSPRENGGPSQREQRDQRDHRDQRENRDPQGYDKPVNFVRPELAEAKDESERTDEEEEELREKRRRRDRDQQLRDRERAVESRERHRIESINRELAHRRQQEEYEDRNRRRLTELLEDWDDDEKAEKGREWFYIDRARWRNTRQKNRMREYQDDLRDRHKEEEERKALEIESEEFLKRQMAEMVELEVKQRAAGLLTEDAAPIRLALNTMTRPEPKDEARPDFVPSKPSMAFGGDDEEEEEAKKKSKRTLVKLEYEGDGLTEAEQLAKRNAKLLEIRNGLPRDRKRLFAAPVEWASLSESLLRDKIKPFVQGKMKDLLGEVDEDLVDFVLEHLREKKGPGSLVDGLEPVFTDEAIEFVISLWRQLSFESIAWASGLETGNMMA